MMSMKKIIVFVLVTILSFTVISCDFNFNIFLGNDTSTTITTNTSEEQLVLVSNDKSVYELGSSFDASSIVVALQKSSGTQIPLDASAYTVTGFDSSTAGTVTITVTYRGYSTTFDVSVISADTGLVIDMAYYQSAQDLTGQALLDRLHTIINNGFVGVTYGDARYLLDDTDEDPTNANNVILIYTGASVSGVWDEGVTWNREHVWPQSLLGEDAVNTVVNMASDLHNLKPANPSTNISRGNKYYDLTTTVDSFAPRDEVKGDIARILLYMMVMYPDDLELINGTPTVGQMGQLDVLLAWNAEDPVDSFELARNEAIYTMQYNRNPFIDYPEFADLIFDYLP